MVATAVLFVGGFLAPNFVTNSWSYLELSKTVFTDFFHANTIRSFDNPSPYSQAFPPLWPVALAVARRVVDLGIYTGFVLNIPICVALLAAMMRLLRRLEFPGWVGAACYLCAIVYVAETFSGGGIPITLLLLVGALILLFGESSGVLRIAMAGLLMGLACLTRFDGLAPACVIGVAFALRAYRPERKLQRAVVASIVYFAVLGVTLSPMMIYGITHFGKLFPSDNTRMVLQANGGGMLDYFKTPPPSDLSQHPVKWIVGLLRHKVPNVAAAGLRRLEPEDELSPLAVLTVTVLVVWGGSAPLRLPGRARYFCMLSLILFPVMLAPAILGGLEDSRYYSGTILLLTTALIIVLVCLVPDVWSPRRTRLMLLAAALPIFPAVVRPMWIYRGQELSLAGLMAPLSPTPIMRQLTEAVHRDSVDQPHRLIFVDSPVAAAKYGALTGEPLSLVPGLANGTFADFARDWHITHVYTGTLERTRWEIGHVRYSSLLRDIHNAGVELVPLDFPDLYRLRLPSQSPHP